MDTNKRKEIFLYTSTFIFAAFILILIGMMISFGVLIFEPQFIIYELKLNEIFGIIIGITTLTFITIFIIDSIVLHLLQYKIVSRKKYKEFKKQKAIEFIDYVWIIFQLRCFLSFQWKYYLEHITLRAINISKLF